MDKSVMFVDDDEAFLLFVKQACTKISAIGTMLVAGDGLEALDSLKQNISANAKIPDVIFVDINMPRMDGFTFLAEFQTLKNKNPELSRVRPIAMLTSSDQGRGREKASSLGADAYIVKSTSLKETRRIIESLVIQEGVMHENI